jgi:hypothetical protein
VGIRFYAYLCKRGESRARTPISAFTPVYANWKDLSAEATVKGLRKGAGLKLEFWVETPSGNFEEQAKINIKELSVGEEARYTAEFTPREVGIYIIHAYLSDEWIRIGHKTNSIYVQKE